MEMTLEIPDKLAGELQSQHAHLPKILEFGLRELRAARQAGFTGAAEVLEKLADLPTPQEVLALRPSKSLQKRIDELLEKNRLGGLTAAEEQEWQAFQYLEHLVRMAKAKAQTKLQNA